MSEDIDQFCNCCGCTEFEDWGGRAKVMCKACLSMERTRAMMLFIDHFGLAKPSIRALHFAPDTGISNRLRKMIGEGYEACDNEPVRYPKSGTRQFDLTTDIEDLPSRTYHLILHSHVMEAFALQLHSRSLSPSQGGD